ncbi:MAG: DUF58 domain-containing protein [Spirochaetaceae bacterium]|jgi:hypothetical protein|nr:DUF58 domain-containing protein [Spirochaetaceae bacterium]
MDPPSKPQGGAAPGEGFLIGDLVPLPQTLGVFTLIITAFAFTSGTIRGEPVLVLVSAVFLAILAYGFLAVLFLSLLHRNAVKNACLRIMTPAVQAGTSGRCVFERAPAEKNSAGSGMKGFFKLPGTIVRYTLLLRTQDGRAIRRVFDPDAGAVSFPAPFRGAYYTAYDEFSIADLPGFFRMAFRIIPQNKNPRLLVTPRTLKKPPDIRFYAGGGRMVCASKKVQADTLAEARPYMPGDDPRRINWKLYSHAGDLFVRQGQREPPPRSRLLILVDCEADPSLYTGEEARRGVDMLCEAALSLAETGAVKGAEVRVSYAGGKEAVWGKKGALAALLAHPAASPPAEARDFAAHPAESGILVLALPRLPSETSALDRLLRSRGSAREVQVVFLYEDEKFAKFAPCAPCGGFRCFSR